MKRIFLFAAMLLLGGAMAWAQNTSTGSSSATGNNASTANQSTATSPDQNQTSTGTTGSTTGTATSGSSADTSQQGAAATDNTATSSKGSKAGRLPQTASPLPFLGMLGFGSMAAGMMLRKLRK